MFFFDSKGVIHKEFVPQGQTVNAVYYVDMMERLRKKRWSGREKQCATNPRVPRKVAPVPSPNVVPADLFLFPQIKATFVQ